MGMDLMGFGTTEHLSQSFWLAVLEMASSFGWEPAGTRPQDAFDDEWDAMNYWSNDYQEVSDADAKALGEALNRALMAMRTKQTLTEKQVQALWDMSEESIRQLADFCARGGFLIG